MDQVNQQNAAMVEATNAVSATLATQSDNLRFTPADSSSAYGRSAA